MLDIVAVGRELILLHNQFANDGRRGFVYTNSWTDPGPEEAATWLLTVEDELSDWDREQLRIFIRHTYLASIAA
ncbi:MAG: hypothetical protein NUV96_00565 [Candidatus Colwellbacteria bacterium]|nr:hypothetical protein [Candidatus Colwellbacteria bacterium]